VALFLPSVAVDKVTDVTPQLIRAMKVRAVILDVDNTLADNGSQIPLQGTLEWAKSMRAQGVEMIIMSNNFRERVAPFAAKFDLPFLCVSMKPLPFAYRRAARKMGVRVRDVVVVGDQIFTDVIGANLAFMKSILLVPVSRETSVSFKIRRALEKPLRRYVKTSQRGKNYFE
jgi:HAD superfamily (subfamily IIIA) phosphatase, TIGR01668